jgi:glyoxylase-like metal-dependent hydrolase (beta-lactamase superfamily II)
VLVTGFPAEAFGTNCYVVAPGPGEQCLIVDPGIGVLDRLDEVLAQHRLFPAAVLLTHGHLDHTFSVAPVCGARGITAYVHPADREMLANPALGLSASVDQLFGGQAGLHVDIEARGAHRVEAALGKRFGDKDPRHRLRG